jgi:hypothetical protein
VGDASASLKVDAQEHEDGRLVGSAVDVEVGAAGSSET